ncbi:hypothetical protein [Dysgonomonas sp. 520]|uniref:hypothetical protein n=1 Tax=Dysgonomonas sp. 520 TaxID=2302931 RepID=UPI0013D75EEF|nr:hypothetical protein [Dysgonomonas sp. 520]NDW09838.1 hypothetical protein [Dysgonomonas sp. 520]
MIDIIVDTFKDVCRQHKLIKSFHYNRTYELGSGNDAHPLIWLEDPMYISNFGQVGQGLEINLNFSVLLIPQQNGITFQECQNLAFSTGLNIIEYIKKNSLLEIKPNWTALTLQRYYDDNTSGARFSLTVVHPNITNLCLLDEHFDTDKEFEVKELINDFDVTPASNCTTFVNKLPDFNLPTTR